MSGRLLAIRNKKYGTWAFVNLEAVGVVLTRHTSDESYWLAEFFSPEGKRVAVARRNEHEIVGWVTYDEMVDMVKKELIAREDT